MGHGQTQVGPSVSTGHSWGDCSCSEVSLACWAPGTCLTKGRGRHLGPAFLPAPFQVLLGPVCLVTSLQVSSWIPQDLWGLGVAVTLLPEQISGLPPESGLSCPPGPHDCWSRISLGHCKTSPGPATSPPPPPQAPSPPHPCVWPGASHQVSACPCTSASCACVRALPGADPTTPTAQQATPHLCVLSGGFC